MKDPFFVCLFSNGHIFCWALWLMLSTCVIYPSLYMRNVRSKEVKWLKTFKTEWQNHPKNSYQTNKIFLFFAFFHYTTVLSLPSVENSLRSFPVLSYSIFKFQQLKRHWVGCSILSCYRDRAGSLSTSYLYWGPFSNVG